MNSYVTLENLPVCAECGQPAAQGHRPAGAGYIAAESGAARAARLAATEPPLR